MTASMTLSEIADASGLPARTIRFYIARGILPGPLKAGRGAAYTPEHVARIAEIQRLQSEGRTLAEISRRLSEEAPVSAAPEPTAWWQHAIADDVVVWVRAGAGPWRTRQVRAAVAAFARMVEPASKPVQKEHEDDER
jgi:DNA-binding transcriptional MerR regulator